MTILNPTDAAKATITPDGTMLLRLEHADGSPAGRINLAGLATFLASAASSGSTATASTYTLSLSSSSVVVGTAITVTAAPTSAAWPSGEVLTWAVSGVAGTFSSATSAVSGSTPATTQFTPSAAGTAAINATSSPAMTNPAAASLTVTAAASSTSTYSFAGAAGAPTGQLALTQSGGTSISSMVLNGSGALLMASTSYAFGLFESLPALADGTITVTAASAPQPLNLCVIFRSTASGTNAPLAVFNHGGLTIYNTGAANNPQFSGLPETFTSLSVSVVGQVFTATVDGTQYATVTATTFPASGYVGLGSSGDVSSQVQVASLQITPR